MRKYQHPPTEAWAQSLCPILLIPFFLMGLGGLVSHFLGDSSSGVLLLFVGVVGMFVHFAAYFLVGLPIYVLFWEECQNLWTWKIGLPIGVTLGGCVICVPFLWINGVTGASELATTFLVGGAYGLITAAAAITSRRKNQK